jgi:hypothetical protein
MNKGAAMDRLAKIEKQVASMRKTEQTLAVARAKSTQARAAQEAAHAAEQKPKRLLFAALFDAPEPKPKAPGTMSRSAKRRFKLQLQFEALGNLENSIVRRKHH